MAKELTVDNFLLPDPGTSESGVTVVEGRTSHRSAVDWAHEILTITVTGEIPAGVRDGFERARAMLLYGFFWYPFWAQGALEALRAAEAALEIAGTARGAPKRATTAEARLAWLAKRRVLAEADVERWTGLRSQVTPASFTDSLPVLAPGHALGTLSEVAALIERLFESPA